MERAARTLQWFIAVIAVEQARERLRDGLPLRADINVVGYLARKPEWAERG